MPVPPGTKGRMCDVAITRSKLRLVVKGQPPLLGEACAAAGHTERGWKFGHPRPHGEAVPALAAAEVMACLQSDTKYATICIVLRS